MLYHLILFLGLIQPPTQPLYDIPRAQAEIVQYHHLQKEWLNVCEANKGFWEMLNGATITFPSSTINLTQTVFICGDNITFKGASLRAVERVPIIAITPKAEKNNFTDGSFKGF